jgi:4'-phosphopantetheinyl transferase
MAKVRGGSGVSSEAATPAAEWYTPPELSLPAGAVPVWGADLGSGAARLRLLERNLSADERARAARFRFARDRERFIAPRGLLRGTLALYLDTAARQLSFGYGAHGKPFLAVPEHSGLRFNVSYSLDVVLVAVAHEREVGVDVEYVRSGFEVEAIAETVLSTPEKHALARFDGEPRRMAFLQFWTRKEAYVKADDRGVSSPFEHIDVSGPADQVAVLDEATGKWEARRCSHGAGQVPPTAG